jgi:hypothetical protein
MKLGIVVLAGFIFACGMVVGAFRASCTYEGEIARAEEMSAEAEAYRQMKACAGQLQGGGNLVEVIRSDRAFFACVTDVAERTDARVMR